MVYRYSAESIGKLIGRSAYTVNEHARQGRVDLASLMSVLEYVREHTAPRKWTVTLNKRGNLVVEEEKAAPVEKESTVTLRDFRAAAALEDLEDEK